MIAVLIMIVVVPIMLGMPSMLVFIPPSMIGLPATLTQFVQIPAAMLSLFTPVAMMLDGFVQSVIGLCDTPLAVVIRTQTWRTGKH
jgi:hypothetical protein